MNAPAIANPLLKRSRVGITNRDKSALDYFWLADHLPRMKGVDSTPHDPEGAEFSSRQSLVRTVTKPCWPVLSRNVPTIAPAGLMPNASVRGAVAPVSGLT